MNWTKYISSNITLRKNISLILTLIIFLILGIMLIRYYQYQINADGIVYIGIAKTYFNGNFFNAIDAYRSPLISWLLIPFLIFSSNPVYLLLSTKILSLIIGFFTIIGVRQLSYKFEMNERIRTTILFSLIPIILYFAYSVFTPDLLLVCIFVFYFNIIFSPQYSDKVTNALLCGLLGSLAYLTKSYAFPFFIVHFILFNLFHYFKSTSNRRKTLKNLLLGLTMFFIISGAWIGLISYKEGKITYSTAGEFNHNIVGPQSNHPSKGWITHYLGEEVTQIKPWSPFESWNYFKYQLKIIYMNTVQTLNIFKSFSYFSLIILLTYLLFCIKPIMEILNDNRIYPFITTVIFSAGYLLVLVEERYLWLVYVLFILMGGYLLNIIFKGDFFPKASKYVLLLVFAFSFIWMSVSFLNENVNSGKEFYNTANAIEEQHIINGNIVTNNNDEKMIYISYYLETKYMRQTKNDISDTKSQEQLKEYNIDYYFVWGDNIPSFLSNYVEVTNGKIQGLKIYSMKDKVTPSVI